MLLLTRTIASSDGAQEPDMFVIPLTEHAAVPPDAKSDCDIRLVSTHDPELNASAMEKSTEVDPEDARDLSELHLSGTKVYLIVAGLCVSVLLVARDNAILATAVPTITSRFNSLDGVGWYGSAFLMMICAGQPLAGKIFTYFSLKWAYLSFLGLFELGSLVCATAQSSASLIVGSAIVGAGPAGLFSGALVIIAHCIPLRLRPTYMGVIGSMFGVANISGPLIGGALAQHATWRWCFYLNLPCGALTLMLLLVFFKPPKRTSTQMTMLRKLRNLDLMGSLLFVPGVFMLLIALQLGGEKYPWNSGTVVGLQCASAGCLVLYVLLEWRLQDEAGVPPSIFLQRTVFFSAIVSWFTMGGLQLVSYYLPIWFQVILGVDPTSSGVHYLPSVLGDIVASILAGILGSPAGHWIGFQILSGAGIGFILQMPLIAVQAALPLQKVATATSIIVFCQFLGGAVLLAAAQDVFHTKLVSQLSSRLPSMDPSAIISAGAGSVREILDGANLDIALLAYNRAIADTFYIPAAGGVYAFLMAWGLERHSVKGKGFMGSG
ncbi:hypothetical protein MMC25_008074 [Agyrium rufum]|nr:hypothetical protein [Agyrium rufum]